jgi:hypothetical protein
MVLLNNTDAFVTCKTLVVDADPQKRDAFLPHAFFQHSHEHYADFYGFPDRNSLFSVLLFPYPLVLPLRRVPLAARYVQRPTKAHVRRICVQYYVGLQRSN